MMKEKIEFQILVHLETFLLLIPCARLPQFFKVLHHSLPVFRETFFRVMAAGAPDKGIASFSIVYTTSLPSNSALLPSRHLSFP